MRGWVKSQWYHASGSVSFWQSSHCDNCYSIELGIHSRMYDHHTISADSAAVRGIACQLSVASNVGRKAAGDSINKLGLTILWPVSVLAWCGWIYAACGPPEKSDIAPFADLDFNIRILKPWGCKQAECHFSFLKTNAKSGSSFHQNVGIYQSYPNEFYQNFIFHGVLLSYFGFWIDKTNCLKIPLTLADRRSPSWSQWICLRGWCHGFTNPDSVSEILIQANAKDFETSFVFVFLSNQTGPK